MDVEIDFYDLPNGSFFQGRRWIGSGAKFGPEIYHKTSQGTAYDITDPSVTIVGSDFWGVVEVERPS